MDFEKNPAKVNFKKSSFNSSYGSIQIFDLFKEYS